MRLWLATVDNMGKRREVEGNVILANNCQISQISRKLANELGISASEHVFVNDIFFPASELSRMQISSRVLLIENKVLRLHSSVIPVINETLSCDAILGTDISCGAFLPLLLGSSSGKINRRCAPTSAWNRSIPLMGSCLSIAAESQSTFAYHQHCLNSPLILMFDGACRGNPGKAAAGVHLAKRPNVPGGVSTTIRSESIFLGYEVKSNQAEYKALIRGLELCNAAFAEGELRSGRDGESLVVQGDSALVINQMKGTHAANKMAQLFKRATFLAEQLHQSFCIDIFFQWIPRDENNTADRLASQAFASCNRSSHLTSWYVRYV